MSDSTNHPVFPNPLGTENPENCAETTPQSLLDEQQFQNVLITKDGEPDCIPLSTKINLKCKKRMLYFPMDFGELTIDGLIDTGALSSAIPETDLRKIRLLSPQSVIREGLPPNFQIMVANGQLETPTSTIELNGAFDRTNHRTNVLSAKSYSSGHETRDRELTVLLYAAQNSGYPIFQCPGTDPYSDRSYHSPK